ncbi:MAG: TldD/PmbA family protein [Candidatus Cloacimonetes bacterium]|nr:TldD/PmbA family protein [Candidatus Cloacimonadota bacterium]
MFNNIIDKLLKLGAQQADDIEVLIVGENSFSVRVHDQQIEAFNYSDSKGLGIRVLIDGQVGVSYTEDFNESALQMVVREAVANARINEQAEKVVLANYPEVDAKLELFNESLEKVPVEDKVALIKDIDRIARKLDKRIINVPYCMYGDGKSIVHIANSKGLNKQERTNSTYSFLSPLAQSGEEKRAAHAFALTRDFSKLNAEELAREAVKNTVELLGGQKFDAGMYPVVFNGETMASMLSTFSGLFSARQVHEGRSLLAGKLGQSIASDHVTLLDDALHPTGFSSRYFDSEGYPSQSTLVVDAGKLKTYLHNTVTAAKDGVHSTGNGTRGYKGDLRITPSNFYLKPGVATRGELFSAQPRLIEIVALSGLHSGANAVSGDFSLSGEGFLWENGERKHSLQMFTVSGNILDMLHDVQAVADDFQFQMNTFGAASTLVGGLSFSG